MDENAVSARDGSFRWRVDGWESRLVEKRTVRLEEIAPAGVPSVSGFSEVLRAALSDAQLRGSAQRVVWRTDCDPVRIRAAIRSAGRWVDSLNTYSVKVESHMAESRSSDESQLRRVRELESVPEAFGPVFSRLFQYSRFNIDPDVSPVAFERIVATWLRDALTDAGRTVLGFSERGFVQGIVVAARETTPSLRGRIELIGVMPEQQGQGIGRALVGAARLWCAEQGLAQLCVGTHAQNASAIGLYESSGMRLAEQHATFVWSTIVDTE